MANDKDYAAVLLEQIVDQNKAVLEAVGDIQRTVANLPTRDEFDELRRDVKATMSALRDVSGQVADHETRISALETA
jgi:hypothetical protein